METQQIRTATAINWRPSPNDPRRTKRKPWKGAQKKGDKEQKRAMHTWMAPCNRGHYYHHYCCVPIWLSGRASRNVVVNLRLHAEPRAGIRISTVDATVASCITQETRFRVLVPPDAARPTPDTRSTQAMVGCHLGPCQLDFNFFFLTTNTTATTGFTIANITITATRDCTLGLGQLLAITCASPVGRPVRRRAWSAINHGKQS